MTARDYKIAHGLPLTRGLVSTAKHQDISDQAKRRIGTAQWARLDAARDPAAAAAARTRESFHQVAVQRTDVPQERPGKSDGFSICTQCEARVERRKNRKPRMMCDDCAATLRAEILASGRAEVTAANATRDAQIVEAWRSGMTKSEIGRREGLTPQRVSQIVRAAERKRSATPGLT